MTRISKFRITSLAFCICSLSHDPHQDLKKRFYELMIEYHRFSNNFLEISRAYQHIFNTELVQGNVALWSEVCLTMIHYLFWLIHSNTPYFHHRRLSKVLLCMLSWLLLTLNSWTLYFGSRRKRRLAKFLTISLALPAFMYYLTRSPF